MDAGWLKKHVGKVMEVTLAHVVIPLMGRYKGGTGSRHHQQAVVDRKSKKLNVGWWMESLND